MVFEESTEQHQAVGEASVFYLYSAEAISNIYKFDKDAKIIAMLRNPVDLVYSFHSELYYDHKEYERDFITAWRLQSFRLENPPPEIREPALLQYSEVGKLGDHVERLLSIFPSDQVKLILFEDFVRSPQAAYEEVLSFLELSSDGRTYFPRINAARRSSKWWPCVNLSSQDISCEA